MRIIDADALKERILEERDAIPMTIVERYSLGVPTPNNHGNSMRGGIRIALRCMEQTPTIEANLVKYGRWEERPVNVGTCTTGLFCSECNFPSLGWRYNYCPNCGAKMEVNDG